jgi:hypothetical protein
MYKTHNDYIDMGEPQHIKEWKIQAYTKLNSISEKWKNGDQRPPITPPKPTPLVTRKEASARILSAAGHWKFL